MRTIVRILVLLLLELGVAAQQNFFENPGVKGERGWNRSGQAAGLTFSVDRKVGQAKRGSLHIENESASLTNPFNWRQVCDLSKAKSRRFQLTVAERGKKRKLEGALKRFLEHHVELRLPTKRLYDYFNSCGHGGYFFFSHRNAIEAARHARSGLRRRVIEAIHEAVLAAREGDGTFMDHYMNGRVYATAMALWILAEPAGGS